MNNNILNKENIIARTDTYNLLNHYLKPYHKNGDLKKGQHISNPFLTEQQKTPSFNIYQSASGMWKFKDFATDDEGDVFNLVMKLKQCDFPKALSVINQDFNIGLNGNQFEIHAFDKWDDTRLSYWHQYGINSEHLKLFNVIPVKSFNRVNQNGNSIAIQSRGNNLIFAYKINADCYKLYSPHSSKYKFSWLGNKPSNYVFGYQQLPDSGNHVFITGGEKDVLSLFAKGQNAICLNSETAIPSTELINKLKSKFKKVVILYDIDNTGIVQSKKICEKFGLSRMILPESLKKHGGKDISDFLKSGFTLNDSEIKMENYTFKEVLKNDGGYLSLLLATQNKLTKRKAETITRTQPILTLSEQGVIYPRTINIIQGKAGVHKSRLAETICSALIKNLDCRNDLLGFKTNILTRPTVCYVDTERNHSEQFPYALQQILQKAGYSKEDTPHNFDYISLLEVPRKDRFKALTEYLEYIRKKFSGHLVIVLDVVTDCIKDFNRSEDSMQLIDLMNESINKYDVTFIGLIHENPGSIDKARGHLGTELMNKSSTVIQVGFEKGKNGQPTDLIVLNFLKTRSTKRFDSIYLSYCETTKGLVVADPDMISDVIQSRKTKADIPQLLGFLRSYLTEPISNQTLITELAEEFDCSSKSIRNRLKEIMDKQFPIKNLQDTLCYLTKNRNGKEMFYSLSPINGTLE